MKNQKHPMFGRHHSNETKKKMSINNGSRKPENRKKISDALKGHILSDETKKKISISMKKFFGTNHPCYGKHLSETTKLKISEANKGSKGFHHSEETKKIISESHKGSKHFFFGKKRSEEFKRNLSEKFTGNKSPVWKGGTKLSTARTNSKRQSYGHNFINNDFKGAVGHHLDKNNVLFIPKELHVSIKHRQTDTESMDNINLLAFTWWESSVL